MTNHRKYRFNQTDTKKYCHRYRTEVRYTFRFSQKTNTDTGTGEPYSCVMFAMKSMNICNDQVNYDEIII